MNLIQLNIKIDFDINEILKSMFQGLLSFNIIEKATL